MRLEGIDLLRGVAVSSVVIYHFFVILGLEGRSSFHLVSSFGIFGVSLFFVISGFLIYRSAEYSLEKYGFLQGLRHYARHRLFRILPAYYFNLAVVILLASTIIDREHYYSFGFIKQIFAHLTFLSYFYYRDAGLGINGAYWTLSIEMLWYLVVIGLLLFIKRASILVFIATLSFLYLWGLDHALFDTILGISSQSPSRTQLLYYYSFQLPGQISYFIAGIVIYKHLSHIKLTVSPLLQYTLALLVYLLFLFVSSRYAVHSSFLYNNLFMLVVTFALFFLLYDARPKMMQPLEWVGKISYSIYLWHMPLLFVMKQTSILRHLSTSMSVFIFVSALLIVSSLSYYLIEEGGFALRKRLETRWAQGAAR